MRAACDAFEDRQLIADTRLRAAMGAQHLQYLKDECQLTRDVLDRATCLLFDSARANGRHTSIAPSRSRRRQSPGRGNARRCMGGAPYLSVFR
jgi:hypothetical protein